MNMIIIFLFSLIIIMLIFRNIINYENFSSPVASNTSRSDIPENKLKYDPVHSIFKKIAYRITVPSVIQGGQGGKSKLQRETELNREEKNSVINSIINQLNNYGEKRLNLEFVRYDEFIKETVNGKNVRYVIDSLTMYETKTFEEIISTVEVEVGSTGLLNITKIEIEPEFIIETDIKPQSSKLDPKYYYRDGKSLSEATVDEKHVQKQFDEKNRQSLIVSKDDFLCFGSKNVRADDKLECESSGGLWDRPCIQNEDCPFFNKNTGNGTCNPISGRCEMPRNTKIKGYRNIDPNPLFSPHCSGCKRLSDGKKEGACCEEQKNINIYPFLKGKPNYIFD